MPFKVRIGPPQISIHQGQTVLVSDPDGHFLLNQLPELYTAFRRNELTFPVQYVGANVPQGWAAGSVFMLTQAILGFLPDAPRNKLAAERGLSHPPGFVCGAASLRAGKRGRLSASETATPGLVCASGVLQAGFFRERGGVGKDASQTQNPPRFRRRWLCSLHAAFHADLLFLAQHVERLFAEITRQRIT